MSRIRDIANILTAANVLSTDVETSAAITSAIAALPRGYQRGNTASRPASPTTGDIYANTETGFVEIYTGATYGWEQVGGIASLVTAVFATNTPTSRAYNNGAASIAFTPGTVLGRTYTVTSSPGSYTASGSVSPITITGLQSSTQYTYTVVAANNYGNAAASAASAGVTATTVPQAPTIGTATNGDAQASVTFTANATGGSAITAYTITSSPGNITANGASPVTVTGLTNGTAYTFTVTSTNANGISAASSASNSVTPTNAVSIDYLLVAGGGAGGHWFGGGGAGGGVRSSVSPTGGGGSAESQLLFTKGVTYTITVGAGATQNGDSSTLTTGNLSSISGSGFTTISATGGGCGGSRGPSNPRSGGPGGSGGGGGGNGTPNFGAASPSGQGYAGGNGFDNSWGSGGGGGGGAGGAGASGAGASKGASITNSITGTSTAYSDGGYGGYGNGTVGGSTSGSATSGSATKGAGGGGAGSISGSSSGASGSAGRVVIKANVAAVSTAGSPSNPSLGIYIFDGTGSITF